MIGGGAARAWAIAAGLALAASEAAASTAATQATYRAYVANESSDLISRVAFTPGAGIVVEKEIPVGVMPGDNDGAHGISVSPDGRFWYVTIAHGTPFGYVWKFAAGPDTLVGRAELGLFPATMGVTPDGQFLLAVNFNLHGDMVPSDVSVVYTPEMLEIARIPTCMMPHGSRVTADGRKQYSVCMHSEQLVEIDIESFDVSARFDVTPGNEALLVAGGTQGPGDHAAHGPIPAPAQSPRPDSAPLAARPGGAQDAGRPQGVAASVCSPTWVEPADAGKRAGQVVYVACNKNREVLEVDTERWAVVRRFPTGAAPYNLEVAKDGSLLLITLKGEQAVAVVDLDAGAEIARIATTRPVTHGIVATPDGRYAFVSNEAVGSVLGTVDVIDLESLSLAASAELRHQPGGIDFWQPPQDDPGP